MTNAAAAGPLRLLQRLVPVRSREVPALLWGFAQMFFLLAGNYVFRPIRDSLGSERGSADLRWLYLGTLAATLVTSAAWSAIVARYPAKKFVWIAYEFFAASFVVIWALLTFAPDSRRVVAFGYFFFVWYSAYNIFIVSAFWSRCADLFTEEQGRRLFPYMVAGGSLGAIAGSGMTASLAERMDTFNLLLIPVALLQIALFCSRRLAAAAATARAEAEGATAAAGTAAPVRGTLASGVRGALQSPFVVMIALYVLFATFCGTCLYNMQSDLARAAFPGRDARTEYFANIDFWVNVLALTSELLIAPRLIAWVGAGTALLLLPAVYAVGLSVAGVNPALATVAGLVIVQRSVAYGLTTPARESLFTVVPREEKYKAKNLIDTFVWRGGDVAAVWLIYAVVAFTTGEKANAAAKTVVVAATGIPIAVMWVLAAWRLRRLHRERVVKAAMPPPE